MRTILKKLKRGRAGFSFAETLIAILILLLVSSIVAAALPSASNVYVKSVDTANAQVLLSTVMAELRNELSDAAEISINGTTIDYKNANGGYREISLTPKTGSSEQGIWLYVREFNTTTGQIGAGKDPRLLVSSAAATKGLVVSYASATLSDEGVLTISGLKVQKNGTGPALAECTSFTIRGLKQPDA